MAAGFVCYPVEAGGTGHCPADQQTNFGGGLGEREAERSLPQLAPAIRREACGFEDLGRFNLWRPMVVARTGGSKCMQAQPAGSRWASALPTSPS